MKNYEMTEDAAGQLLLDIYDQLDEAYLSLCLSGYVGHAHVIGETKRLIENLFNDKHKNKSHGFGL